jgi:hypothetical protein
MLEIYFFQLKVHKTYITWSGTFPHCKRERETDLFLWRLRWMGSHIISSQDDDDGIIAGAIKLLWEIGLFISCFLCLSPNASRVLSLYVVLPRPSQNDARYLHCQFIDGWYTVLSFK